MPSAFALRVADFLFEQDGSAQLVYAVSRLEVILVSILMFHVRSEVLLPVDLPSRGGLDMPDAVPFELTAGTSCPWHDDLHLQGNQASALQSFL